MSEPTPALWPTAHQAVLAGQSPAIPGPAPAAECDYTPCRYEERHDADGSWDFCVEHDMSYPCDVDVVVTRLREAPQPTRPYREGTPLVVVSESEWDEAQEAFSQVIELQDAVANANAYVERLPEKVADFLLSYSGDGDTSDPQGWQAGHNYAMREAARMVREKWYALDEGDPTPEDGWLTTPPGEPTGGDPS